MNFNDIRDLDFTDLGNASSSAKVFILAMLVIVTLVLGYLLMIELFEPGAEINKGFYAEKPISIRMLGSYHQFGQFVSGVASLPRVVIMTMSDIELKPVAGQSAGDLSMQGTLKTFRYLDEDELLAQGQTEAANG
jgi:type IV pilus assembly protein PilO